MLPLHTLPLAYFPNFYPSIWRAGNTVSWLGCRITGAHAFHAAALLLVPSHRLVVLSPYSSLSSQSCRAAVISSSWLQHGQIPLFLPRFSVCRIWPPRREWCFPSVSGLVTQKFVRSRLLLACFSSRGQASSPKRRLEFLSSQNETKHELEV